MELVNKEDIKIKSKGKAEKVTTEKITTGDIIKKNKGNDYTEESLRSYAEFTIKERIKFCQEYKKEEDLNKCARESIIRWIRLFSNSPMKGSKELGKLRVQMVERVLGEMIKEGKI